MFTDKGFSAAAVTDQAGRPIGVLSRSDVLVHDREAAVSRPRSGPQVSGRTCARDLMTPTVFCVTPKTPVATVVREMLALRVHRLFVADAQGVLIGVITPLDILRHLQPEETNHRKQAGVAFQGDRPCCR